MAAGAWRLAKPTQSPPYPKPMGRPCANVLRALEPRAPGIGAVTGRRGSRHWASYRQPTPTLQQLSQFGAQACRRSSLPRWSGFCGHVFGSVLHGHAANQTDVDLLVDFQAAPSF